MPQMNFASHSERTTNGRRKDLLINVNARGLFVLRIFVFVRHHTLLSSSTRSSSTLVFLPPMMTVRIHQRTSIAAF